MLQNGYVLSLMLADTDKQLNSTSNKTNKFEISLIIENGYTFFRSYCIVNVWGNNGITWMTSNCFYIKLNEYYTLTYHNETLIIFRMNYMVILIYDGLLNIIEI